MLLGKGVHSAQPRAGWEDLMITEFYKGNGTFIMVFSIYINQAGQQQGAKGCQVSSHEKTVHVFTVWGTIPQEAQ